MQNHQMFSEKILMIPDYVLPRDVPAIYNYFKNFNIADINFVEYKDHKQEDWDEDKPFYGYALIEVNNWYNNTGAENFYKSIFNNTCRMVYDDPFYWELKFYNHHVNCYNSPNNIENDCFNLEEENGYKEVKIDFENDCNCDCDCGYDDYYDYDDYDNYDDNYEEYYSGDEKDDINDKDYEYQDTDDEEDKPYEYEYLYSKIDKKITLKKKPKTNNNNDSNDNTNNKKKISELLTSKNYMRRNKRKDFKNVWVRRLRQKTN